MSYPKTYATVVRVEPDGTVVARADRGGEVTTHIRARNGSRTPTASVVRGLRIKLYERPGGRVNFRRVGR